MGPVTNEQMTASVQLLNRLKGTDWIVAIGRSEENKFIMVMKHKDTPTPTIEDQESGNLPGKYFKFIETSLEKLNKRMSTTIKQQGIRKV